MAQVHIARQVGPDGFVKPCVLKRITRQLQADKTLRRMFMEEARVSALMNHPNLVQTFDYGEIDGTPYMAMELVDGVNLAQLCRALAERRRWLPLQPIIELVTCILKALDYAHNLADLSGTPLNVIHRDVSPQNTLLSRTGAVKLADFGIARHEKREQHTLRHTAKGKPGYMAPEQAMGGGIDARADLFSVGVILTELLSARRVLPEGGKVLGVMEIENRVTKLCAYRTDSPPALTALATRLCSLEPDRRPSTAKETLSLIDAIRPSIPASKPLTAFLENVFEAYLSKIEGELSAPPPPQADSSFEKTWIAEQPAATGTAMIYEGWPQEYLDKGQAPALALPTKPMPSPSDTVASPPPQIEKLEEDNLGLVQNSSSVEAMQFFGAQTSDDAKKRSDPSAEQQDPPPLSVPGIEKIFAETPNEDRPPPTASPAPASKPANKPIVEEEKRQIPTVLWLALGGLAIAAFAVGIITMVGKNGGSTGPVEAERGSLLVKSDPPGATIWIDGRKLPAVTPHTAGDLPLDRPILVRVSKGDFAVTPNEARLRIPTRRKHTSATFKLVPGRRFRIISKPADAIVSIGKRRVPTPTPVLLDPVPLGETASITIERDEYLPAFVAVKSAVDTASVVEVELEPAVRIDISSTPPGAKIFLDKREIGATPAYDVLVPAKRRFRVRIEKPGFKRFRKRLRAKDIGEGPLVAELEAKPLLSLPLEPGEREEAKRLDRLVVKLRRDVAKLKRAVAAAEKKLRAVEESNTIFIGDVAKAQRRFDVLSTKLADAENELADAESNFDAFREDILLRLGQH